MRNYALITTAVSALLIGFTLSGSAVAQDALADTLPSPASSATPKAATAPTASSSTLPASSGTVTTSSSTVTSTSGQAPSTTTATSTLPSSTGASSSSVIVPVTSSSTSTLGTPGNPLGTPANGGLTGTPVMPSAVQDAVTRLQKVDQINLDDMIRAQDAINRLDLLLEIEKRQTELKKVRDERNKPAASASTAAASLLGSAIPASALNLPKPAASLPVSDTPSAPPPSTSFSSKSFSSGKKSDESGPSSKYSIRRITGTDGRYFAVINTEDNSSQTVHAGDKLPDGTIVKSITLTKVSLIKDKKSKELTIPTDSYIVRESGSTSLQ